MRKSLLLRGGATLLAALIVLPAHTLAQTNKAAAANNTATETAPIPKKKQTAGPFRGNLAAVDPVAKTIRVGKRTFQITAETKMLKAGKPATLTDGILGEIVSGGFKTAPNGQLLATKVTFGPKSDTGSADQKKENPDKPRK